VREKRGLSHDNEAELSIDAIRAREIDLAVSPHQANILYTPLMGIMVDVKLRCTHSIIYTD
jgi:hypothetical protein